jgi:hypothetical protein
MRRRFFAGLCLIIAVSASAQKPWIFDVSNVVIGAQKIPTLYFFAVGKWSDAGEHLGLDSTEIQCYKALGFCNVASSHLIGTEANVSLDGFDILRWDNAEIIAVDSSPMCLVATIRADLKAKSVSLSTAGKGINKDQGCTGMDNNVPTVMLLGPNDAFKSQHEQPNQKK